MGKRSRSRSRSPSPGERRSDSKKSKKVDWEKGNLSVEETNELRKQQGLAPLGGGDGGSRNADSGLDSNDEAAVAAERERVKAEIKARETEEIKKDLVRRRKERELREKLKAEQSLGESLQSDTGGSAADWVARSRKLAKKQKKLAAERAAKLDAQDEQVMQSYDASALKGLKVAHTVEQFAEGSSIVLTLKDQNILDFKDGDLVASTNSDELENIALTAQEKTEKNLELKKKKPLYDVYNEEDNTLLSKYDEEKEKEGFTLGEDGNLDEARKRRTERIREKLNNTKAPGKKMYSLEASNVETSDYLPVAFKKKMRKKRKNGKKAKKPEIIEDFIPMETLTPAGQQLDHGSRTSKTGKGSAASEAAAKLKDASYLKALQKAEKKQREVIESLKDVFEEDHDAELQASLERARRVAAEKRAQRAKRKEEMAAKDGESRKQKALGTTSSMEALAERMKNKRQSTHMADAEGSGDEVDLVFTATSEFCRGLEEADKLKEEEEEENALKEARKKRVQGENKQAQRRKGASKVEEGSKQVEKMEDEDNEDTDGEVSDEDSDDDDNGYLEDEPQASVGMSQALQLIKQRNLVKFNEKLYSEQTGRNRDKQEQLTDDPAPNIQIRHLDEFGREMTPKEAFRKLSHVFHGRGPGLVKQEKMRKKRIEAARRLGTRADKASSEVKFAQRQKETGQAFVVLDRKFAAARPKKDMPKVPKHQQYSRETVKPVKFAFSKPRGK